MALSKEELEEMMRVKAQHPELIAMDCSGRHSRLNPKFNLVKELIGSGALGEIYHIHHQSVSRQSSVSGQQQRPCQPRLAGIVELDGHGYQLHVPTIVNQQFSLPTRARLPGELFRQFEHPWADASDSITTNTDNDIAGSNSSSCRRRTRVHPIDHDTDVGIGAFDTQPPLVVGAG